MALAALILSAPGVPARGQQASPERAAVDPADLQTFMAARAGVLRACYEKALRRRPSLRGRMSLRFTILSDGALEDVAITRDEVGEGVAGCVTSRVRGWRAPFRPSWPVQVEYPLLFTHSE